jgi:tetratricopeptide (TPR) repeat protein
MNALRCCAAVLLVATLPHTAAAEASAVDRDTCVNSDNTATPDAAMAACTRLVEALARGELTAPEGAAVHMIRGNLYAVRRDVEHAIADYDRAIALDADRALAFFNRAGALVASGQIDRALADYNRAIELDPMDADAYVGRARVLYQKKDFVAALADYNAALRLTPDDVDALAERGDAHERAGMYDRASDDYSRLIAIEPGNAKAWNNRCWDRAVLGRLDDALGDCNEALRLAPTDPGSTRRLPTMMRRSPATRASRARCTAAAKQSYAPRRTWKAAAPISPQRKRSIRASPPNLPVMGSVSERYCSGSVATESTAPTASLVRGSGPRPSAKARSSTRRPCSSPGRPKFPSMQRGS